MTERFSTHCYVMPVYNQHEVDPSIHLIDNKIQVAAQGRPRTEFSYNSLFSNQHEFIKSSFNRIVAPLVKQTAEGESTMVVFGGLQSLKLNEFLLSHTVMQGLISQAAGQLLNSVNEGDHKIGSVTFSWFKIECGTPEVITDVLKTASTSNGAPSSGKGDSLVLRELGRGRGMVVPGLWEVEVAGGGDIEAVINHLQKIVPEAADHSAGTAHTVMQLTVTNQTLAAKAKPHTDKQAHSAVGTVADAPGVGRITFVLLSNLAPAPKSGSGRTTPGAGKVPYYPWVAHTDTVMKWLESRHASTPFHKSRLLLFLKDVLLRRQSAALVLMLQPTNDQHHSNLEWMRLFAQLSADHTASSSSGANASSEVSTPMVEPVRRSVTIGGDSVPAGGGGGDSGGKSTAGKPPARPAPTVVPVEPYSPGAVSPPSSRSATPTPTGNSSSTAARGAGFTPGASAAGGGLQRRTSFSSTSSGAGAGATGAAKGGLERRGSFMRMGSGTFQDFSAAALDESQGGEAQGPAGPSETEKALQVALEASQSEAAALKLAYQYSSEKYGELKTTYEDLLEQLKEEGAFLVKRDKERFRAALKDLKDYEIYKEVMEAAMVRMQQELEAYAEENAAIKQARAAEDKQTKRHKEFNEKYSKDLVATKKKLSEAQSRIAVLEKQVKQANKEREVAVAVLAQFKSSGAQQEGQSRMQEQLMQQEIHDLQKRLRRAEEKCRALEVDKEALLASTKAKVDETRTAHGLAMERLMSYQEENDLLRAAVPEAKLQEITRRLAAQRSHSSVPDPADTPLPPPPPQQQSDRDSPSVRSNSITSKRSVE